LPTVTRYETYAHLVELPLIIERCELQPIVRDTTSGFTKVSTVVRLSGADHVGEGEDITWDQIDQIEFLRAGGELSWLNGTRTFDEFSRLLALANLFPVRPIRESAHYYRRWAFESAALDLARRQNGVSFQHAVGRRAQPVNFVASVRIGDPPNLAILRAWLGEDPQLRFKLDPTPSWDDGVVRELAHLRCVDVIDLKGFYRNLTVAMEPEMRLYRRVIEGLPARRRDVRAGPGAWATAIPRLVVSPGRAQPRRAAGIQPPRCCGRAAPGAAGTRASPHRLPAGRLRRASHHT
jgi:hypothetical protein